MSAKEYEIANDWLKHSQIKLPDEKIIHLEKPQRYQLLKLLFRSNTYSHTFKEQILSQEKDINFSDFDLLEGLGCQASSHEDQIKIDIFLSYTGLASLPKDGKFERSNMPLLYNVKQIEASSKHFYNMENLKQTERFADYFFETVEYVFKNHTRDYASNFFAYLSPTFLRREKDLRKFEDLLAKHKDSEDTNFLNLISNEIDLFH